MKFTKIMKHAWQCLVFRVKCGCMPILTFVVISESVVFTITGQSKYVSYNIVPTFQYDECSKDSIYRSRRLFQTTIKFMAL